MPGVAADKIWSAVVGAATSGIEAEGGMGKLSKSTAVRCGAATDAGVEVTTSSMIFQSPGTFFSVSTFCTCWLYSVD